MDWTFLSHLLASILVASGACLGAIHRQQVQPLARAFALSAPALGVANLLLVMARSFAGGTVQQTARLLLSPSAAVSTWIAGTALVFSVAAIAGRLDRRAARLAAFGASTYVATAFAGFELGKALHDAEMRQFFLGSGLPVWFMYAVMGVEIVAAAALLSGRTRLPAAAVLAAVMLGAVATHWRNGDPWSDSSDAIRMLLLALSICLLAWPGRAGAIRGATSSA